MFAKYNDNLAAVILSIYLLAAFAYAFQFLFLAEWSLANRGIMMDPAPQVGMVARAVGTAWLGLSFGILLTLLRGPDGQKIFYDSLMVVQSGVLAALWHAHLIEQWPFILPDALIVTVITAMLVFVYFRVKPRLS